jgi:hypothetical protein
MPGDANIAAVAEVLADRSRRILLALADGRALPASHLATEAGTRAEAVGRARTCYDHMAERLGVALLGAFLSEGILKGNGGFDVGVDCASGGRRPFVSSVEREVALRCRPSYRPPPPKDPHRYYG